MSSSGLISGYSINEQLNAAQANQSYIQHRVKKIIGNTAYKYAIYINNEFMIIKNCVFYNNSQVIYMMIWLCKSGKGRHVNMMKL